MQEESLENSPERVSIPLHGGGRRPTEADLLRHSYDLVLFPMYLARNMAERVTVVMETNVNKNPDLFALYATASGGERSLYAHLKADVNGVATDSDALYHAIHAAFAAAAADGDSYTGFARLGKPPCAPLFALALLYRKYGGKGLYRAGELLPTPWPALQFSYRAK